MDKNKLNITIELLGSERFISSIQKVSSTVQSFARTAPEQIKALPQTLHTNLQKAASSIQEFVRNVPSNLQKAASSIQEFVRDVPAKVRSLPGLIKEQVNSAAAAIMDLPNKARSALPSILNNVQSFFSDAVQKLHKASKDGGNAVANLEKSASASLSGFSSSVSAASIAWGGFIANLASNAALSAFDKFKSFIGEALGSAQVAETTAVGSNILFQRLGVDGQKAMQVAKELGKELRIGTVNALDNLQKLVKSGLGLDQATELLRRLTNEAITGKSANLSLAQAVSNLSDMYYMELSALGNLSGISENVSDIIEKGLKVLQSQGKYLGLTVGRLDEAARAEAKYAGFIELTNLTLGSSAELQGTVADKTAYFEYRMSELSTKVGTLLQPIKSSFLDFATFGVESIEKFVDAASPKISEIVDKIVYFSGELGKLKDVIKNVIADILPRVKNFADRFKGSFGEAKNRVDDLIKTFKPLVSDVVRDLMGFGQRIQQIFGDIAPGAFEGFNNIVLSTFKGVKDFVSEVIKTFRTRFQGFWDFAKTLFDSILNVLERNKEPINSFLGTVSWGVSKIIEVFFDVKSKVFPVAAAFFEVLVKIAGIIIKIAEPIVAFLLPILLKLGEIIIWVVVKAFEFLGWILGNLANGVVWLLNKFSEFFDWLSPSIDWLRGQLYGFFDGIKKFFTEDLPKAFGGAWKGVKDALNSVVDFLNKNVIAGLNDFIKKFNRSLGRTLNIKIDLIPNIPKLALGTMGFEGGVALVGEKGPELVYLPKGSRVVPASESLGNTQRPSSDKVIINITNNINSKMDLQEFYRMLKSLKYYYPDLDIGV